ncbi:hypothetical protein HD554DRAFT_1527211 [Boletus coccyginus]|nr:hypothetical protein HD554DRAFT_1527211 [Boletus coccyginus]
MTMTLVRVPLTLAAAFAFHVSMSPPWTSDADTPGDRRIAIRTTARLIAATLTKGFYWASALADTLVLLAPIRPSTWELDRSFGPPLFLSLHFSFPLPLATVAGMTLALAGAFLRYAAYDALGQFYACRNRGPGPCVPVVLRGAQRGHAHALITIGPYALVRHPGYAGLALCTMGLVMLQLDALKASDLAPWGVIVERVSFGMRHVALVCAILATGGAVRRIPDEERMLRARFKGEWEVWAERVRYKLVPGVY